MKRTLFTSIGRGRWLALVALAAVTILAALADPALACGPSAKVRALMPTAEKVLAGCSRTRAGAIQELRAAGPDGLEALFAYEDKLRWTAPPSDDPEAAVVRQQRLAAAIDAVGGQRDCAASHLYWYTDFDAALAAAQECGKPILSLRLLGNLTDEFSCANSRFFRTTLYANNTVSAALRQRFILHWQSVRPVPKVTIDFGDGRKLERTLTGNSIHYVLDSHGRVIDALPGLYGPAAFLRGLDQAEIVATAIKDVDDATAAETLAAWHAQRQAEIAAAWRADLDRVAAAEQPQQAEPSQAEAAPRAQEAAPIARTKARAEVNLLAAISPEEWLGLEDATDDATWNAIAALHAEDAHLDQASIALMRAKNPNAAVAGRRALTKRVVEDPLLQVVANFQSSIALDTVRNEYLLHRHIHRWLTEAPVTVDLAGLNERVYAELFLTPSSDPWLGLIPENTYTALENDGVVTQ
jgi:hypothetical protein